jgi:hypothetical protein
MGEGMDEAGVPSVAKMQGNTLYIINVPNLPWEKDARGKVRGWLK